MPSPDYPKLTLAQAIIKAIAEHTGRNVRGAEVYAFSDYVSVTAALEEDGSVNVEFSDPLAPGPELPA
ncbi:hypothetical protein [Pseudogemmobacter humi]|uniref:Uncharacterized protein n=1 Tax=Pseudogemmobacter humi TaxID=2483812 RepID=A0A3P5XKN4_9RHOB|nr:hypothetical protein [Pseudogemmobacter humi]VDC28244.1 hypothetical protein XINFAN_02020 [Pseudogemmobacter humi]